MTVEKHSMVLEIDGIVIESQEHKLPREAFAFLPQRPYYTPPQEDSGSCFCFSFPEESLGNILALIS